MPRKPISPENEQRFVELFKNCGHVSTAAIESEISDTLGNKLVRKHRLESYRKRQPKAPNSVLSKDSVLLLLRNITGELRIEKIAEKTGCTIAAIREICRAPERRAPSFCENFVGELYIQFPDKKEKIDKLKDKICAASPVSPVAKKAKKIQEEYRSTVGEILYSWRIACGLEERDEAIKLIQADNINNIQQVSDCKKVRMNLESIERDEASPPYLYVAAKRILSPLYTALRPEISAYYTEQLQQARIAN